MTEAGPAFQGTIKSATAFGALLSKGIGDTIRVSLSAPPVEEVKVGNQILQSLNLARASSRSSPARRAGAPRSTSTRWPTQVTAGLEGMTVPLRVAVMGCVVNGPGEAREADLGVASGNGKGQIFVKGEVIKTVPESQIVETLIEEAMRIAEEMGEPVDGRPPARPERHRRLTRRCRCSRLPRSACCRAADRGMVTKGPGRSATCAGSMGDVQRLSPLDASFIHLERRVQQLNVGSVMAFEGPPPRFAELEARVGALLDELPRYRQRIRRVPGDLGRPVWADDPHFELRKHLAHLRLGPGASDEALRTLAVRLIAAPLDLDLPPWRTWLVTGLAHGRWALVNTNHHAMIDGTSGADIVGVLLAPTRWATARATSTPWTPEPDPSALRLLAGAAASLLVEPVRVVTDVGRTLRPGRLTARLVGAAAGARGLVRLAEELVRPEFGLTGALGPARRWEWVAADLEEVKQVTRLHGGTVNDVVLSATAGGFRQLLESRGHPVDGVTVRSMVPVSTRRDDEHGRLGNRVSAVFADLPVGIADPVERLHAVTEQLGSLKASGEALGVEGALAAADHVPGAMLSLAVRTWAHLPQRMFSTVTTDVPGPRVPLYLLGRRMTDIYPYIPLGAELRVTVGITSYAGRLTWGVTGDHESVPDLAVLARGIEQGLAELIATTTEQEVHHARVT